VNFTSSAQNQTYNILLTGRWSAAGESKGRESKRFISKT